MAAINIIKSVKPGVTSDSVHTLAMMLEVGMGELPSATHLSRAFPGTDLGLAYGRITDRVPDLGLADAFAEETGAHKTIPSVVSELLSAGAATGKEASNLQRAAAILERNSTGRAKMRSALLSPTITVVLVIVLVIALAVGGVPYMHGYYQSMGLPDSPTSLVITIIADVFAAIAGIIVVGGGLWALFWQVRGRRSEKVRVRTNRFVLRVPVWGPAQRMQALSKFFDVLGPLLEAGITETVALERAAEACGSEAMRWLVLEHVRRMKEGENTAAGTPAVFANFADGTVFPSEITVMLSGAPSGSQQIKVLERLATSYRTKADISAERVVRTLPAYVDGFGMAAAVGLTALVGVMMLDMTLGLTHINGA